MRQATRTRLCLPLLLSVLGATQLTAQGTRPQFGIGLGRSIPTGAFRSDTTGEGFAGGWVLTGHVTMRPPVQVRKLLLRIDGTLARNGANDQLKADLTNAFGASSDERITLIGANASVVYPLASASRFAPSAFIGLGLWHSTISVTSGSGSTQTSATKLGWQLGAELTRGAFFLDVRYVSIAAATGYPGTSFFPVTIGLRFGKTAH